MHYLFSFLTRLLCGRSVSELVVLAAAVAAAKGFGLASGSRGNGVGVPGAVGWRRLPSIPPPLPQALGQGGW